MEKRFQNPRAAPNISAIRNFVIWKSVNSAPVFHFSGSGRPGAIGCQLSGNSKKTAHTNRMLKAAVVLLCAAASVLGTGVIDCNPSSIFRPTELGITPTTPAPGDSVFLTVVFDNPGAPVTGGSVTTSVSINGLPLSPSTEALCTNTACPLVTGINNRSTESVWPSDAPTGKIVSKITWDGTNSENLLCLQITVKS